MPTPVGPAPRDPNDPDHWDWTGDGVSSNGGHDDRHMLEHLDRQRRRRRWIALAIVVLVLGALVAASL